VNTISARGKKNKANTNKIKALGIWIMNSKFRKLRDNYCKQTETPILS
jgi:hypothetical protein